MVKNINKPRRKRYRNRTRLKANHKIDEKENEQLAIDKMKGTLKNYVDRDILKHTVVEMKFYTNKRNGIAVS